MPLEAERFELAQALGRQMRGAAGDDRERIRRGFRRCLQRAPEAAEVDVLLRLLRSQGDGGQAWTAVARALLNLDEFLTRP